MKKLILTTLWSLFAILAFAAGEADIKFEKTSHNFGTFPESTPKVTCSFKWIQPPNRRHYRNYTKPVIRKSGQFRV